MKILVMIIYDSSIFYLDYDIIIMTIVTAIIKINSIVELRYSFKKLETQLKLYCDMRHKMINRVIEDTKYLK